MKVTLERRCFGLTPRLASTTTEKLVLLAKRVFESVRAHVELLRALRMGNNKVGIHFSTRWKIRNDRIVPKFSVVAR